MNNQELNNIIEQIKIGEGEKLAAIAKKSGVNRSYLSTLINNEETIPVDDAFLGKIMKSYPTYFNKQKPTEAAKIDKILASLEEIREFAITLITGQTAGQEVIMGSLDRLESNPEGSLSEAADRLALRLAERLNVIQKGRKADVGKQS